MQRLLDFSKTVPEMNVKDFSALSPRDRLIVALDYSKATDARQLVARLDEAVSTYKIGKQLFTAEGPDLVRQLVRVGKRIFLDLKYHDIPNTVAGAVKSAAALGVSMLTVHASGGSAMLKAAVDAAAESSNPPMILAVTVLTSLADQDLQAIGVSGRVLDQVLRLATLARNSGCDGIVASPHEASEIRRELGEGFAMVTPGVRPAGAEPGDQARVLTPAQALEAGATHIVVGRPITAAPDPVLAAEGILRELGPIAVPEP